MITSVKCKPGNVLLPFLAGTVYSTLNVAAMKSGVQVSVNSFRLLTFEERGNILDSFAWRFQKNWRNAVDVVRCVRLLGGHPRSLETLISTGRDMVDLSHFTLLTIISALPNPGVLRVEIFQKLFISFHHTYPGDYRIYRREF